MNILNVLTKNFNHGSRTRKPGDSVPYPEGFRGVLVHKADQCTACGTCVYSCSPGAITIENEEPTLSNWNYTEDQCTFCGFCVQNCPTHALSFEKEAPAPIASRSQHYIFHTIELEPCPVCGKPVHRLPQATLEQLYGRPLPQEIVESENLCENCRQELVSKRFLNALVVKGDRKND